MDQPLPHAESPALAVWPEAAPGVAGPMAGMGAPAASLAAAPRGWRAALANWRAWLRLTRPHQWLKNALVAVPLFTAHVFTLAALGRVALAALAFSVCAASVYILNDLIDRESDRSHPTKRHRPLASGAVPVRGAIMLAAVLLVVAAALGALVSPPFLGVLAVYYAGTLAYSFVLKREMLVDVVALACLYTIRVVAGGVALAVPISEWLLAFSTFVFLSLALIKRHAEMALRLDAGLPDPADRSYRLTDLPIITALAGASGYCAVIVFALYLSSDTVRALYARPQVLWLVCPAILYWVSRMLMLSHRHELDDDPVLFAMRDRASLATVGLILLLMVLAI